MPIFRLGPDKSLFPDPAMAEPNGMLAVGGDLSAQRLLAAYRSGIFPWFDASQPILWWSPDPRMVLRPSEVHVSRSLRKSIRRLPYEIRFDSAFSQVIRSCAHTSRPGQGGTWITASMAQAYETLHGLGHAHSAEAWLDGRLVGGLYGVCQGGAFFGESMFASAPDASKMAFVVLARWLESQGVSLIDCQVATQHLRHFGGYEIPRSEFLHRVRQGLKLASLPPRWHAPLPKEAPALYLMA